MAELDRADLLGGDLVWLLSLTFAGRVWRWSHQPVSLTTSIGEVYAFDGGLEAVDLMESLSILGHDPDALSLPFSVTFPVSVAQLIAAGHPLSGAAAEVAIHLVGGTWEARRVVLSGVVIQPTYGAPGEPVEFSVEAELGDDRALVPAATQRVTLDTWTARPIASQGLYYPIVFGAPGVYQDDTGASVNVSGTPALIVEVTGANTDTLLVAGHHVAATTIRISDDTGTGETFSVTNTLDAMGQAVATVDITGAGTVDRASTDWWAAWPGGGGTWNDHRTAARAGAGEVTEWMLRQSTVAVDTGRWEAVRPQLSGYVLAGYVDDPVQPWEWLADNVLPLLPLSILAGPSGLYPVLWRYEAVRGDALDHLEVGPGVSRLGPVSYDTHPRDVVNQVRVDYAPRSRVSGRYRRTVVIQGATSTAEQVDVNFYAKASAGRYGTGAESITTDVVYDNATARRVAKWRVRAHAFPARQVTYEVGQEWGWLALGDVLTLTDAELSITDQVVLVRAIRWTAGALALTLYLIEDPPRDDR